MVSSQTSRFGSKTHESPLEFELRLERKFNSKLPQWQNEINYLDYEVTLRSECSLFGFWEFSDEVDWKDINFAVPPFSVKANLSNGSCALKAYLERSEVDSSLSSNLRISIEVFLTNISYSDVKQEYLNGPEPDAQPTSNIVHSIDHSVLQP